MRVFISGVMQGSIGGQGIENQGYRAQVASILRAWDPEVDIFDPHLIWADSVSYDNEKAKAVLLECIETAAQVDALVAYVPVASMGTALEMWSAYRAGVPVYTVTDLHHNWAVITVSTRIFHEMAEFAAFVQAGGLQSV